MNTETLLSYVREEADRIDAAMRADLAEAVDGCDSLLAQVLDYALFNGGKRVRPLLAVLGARLAGRLGEEVYPLAIAFEYLHAATLVHDDVIDRADERRGRPSLMCAFSPAAAILAGDWLHARAMLLVGLYGGAEGLRIFCEATLGMVDGEFLQLRHVRDHQVAEVDYLAVIRNKTALLIGAACECGGLFASTDSHGRAALRRYGRNLGAAFQMVDDLLDFLGDRASTGKAVGNDLVEGKITLPLLHALRTAASEDRALLVAAIEDPEAEGALALVRDLIERHDGFAYTRRLARTLVDEGVAALAVFRPVADDQYLALLAALGEYVLRRDR